MSLKNIFITGAAAGIGRETALYFAQQGWFVGLFDIDETGLAAVSEKIDKGQCCAHLIDVRDEASVANAISFFARHTDGQMNVLFNNAGIIHAGDIDSISLANHKRLIDINVWGVLNCTIQALPLLKKSTPATIVNMCSASAIYGHPSLTSYAASKMAVKSITEGLDIGLAKHGIKVCDLMPIWVKTDLAQQAANEWKGLKKNDVKISKDAVAKKVWQAVHGSRLHWLMGGETRFYNILTKILPNRITRMTARIILKD